jgi:hypothetical protein
MGVNGPVEAEIWPDHGFDVWCDAIDEIVKQW